MTQKAADFILFKQIIELMQNKAHLTIEGLQRIIDIKASINLGISNELKSYFVKTVPIQRPTIKTKKIKIFNEYLVFLVVMVIFLLIFLNLIQIK